MILSLPLSAYEQFEEYGQALGCSKTTNGFSALPIDQCQGQKNEEQGKL